ncbi:hypothetical protein PVAP13_3KG084400 [Panicum virgatum]|uniref:Uncharacterized protein n=1 Tax=Panicum virgatum TaxID=38727 RepID=A0A8T0UMQ4_PANVG|nr:hypothetical protein PVAP13_3KG084400 [Panicum virgatum]KAG2623860.1 hypothetical protein PVAP13_3KG084400 [Panicum virgatum]
MKTEMLQLPPPCSGCAPDGTRLFPCILDQLLSRRAALRLHFGSALLGYVLRACLFLFAAGLPCGLRRYSALPLHFCLCNSRPCAG